MPDGATIQMDPELIENEAASISRSAERLEEVIDSLTQLTGLIPSEWEGAASDKFVDIMKQKGIPTVTNMYDTCNGMVAFLNKAAEYMRNTDTKISQAFDGVEG